MKKEPLFQLHRQCQLVFMTILLILAITFLACNNPTNESKDWLNMKIRFKTNTTEAIRQASLDAIERDVLDTVTQLHNKDKDFDPFISVIRNSVGDSLNYTIKVTSPTGDTLPVCKCVPNCRPCQQAKVLTVQPVTIPEFATGDYIESVETIDDKQKDASPGKK